MAVMMKRDAAGGAKGAQMAQQPVQKSAQKSALRGMDFAAGEAALSPNAPVQKKEGEDQGKEAEGEDQLAGSPPETGGHYATAAKATTVVVTGYAADKVEFRQTKGSRIGVETSNKYQGQMGEKTIEMLRQMLGYTTTDTTAADGTFTIARDTSGFSRVSTKFGEGAVDQKIVVYLTEGATGVIR